MRRPHQKSASFSNLNSIQPLQTLSTQSIDYNDASNVDLENGSSLSLLDDNNSLFPLPSYCLYSKSALSNEYASEADIIQYLYPNSDYLQEHLPMLVSVLQSITTVVNDLPFQDTEETDDEEEDMIDIDDDEQDKNPYSIVGLNSMKLIIWNNMDYNSDLCLVVIVSSHITDSALLKNMDSLKQTIDNIDTANDISIALQPYIEDLFRF